MPPMYLWSSHRYHLGYFSDEWEHAPPATRVIAELYRQHACSLWASSPIWASEASLARTRERAARLTSLTQIGELARRLACLWSSTSVNFAGMPAVKTGMAKFPATSVLLSEQYPRQYRRPWRRCITGIWEPGFLTMCQARKRSSFTDVHFWTST